MARHHYLAQKLKRIYMAKRGYFHRAAKIRQFPYEDRLFAKDVGLEQLLLVDQLPGLRALNLMRQFLKKQMMLRQMIVAKYATNSLDIHYLLAKALDLEAVSSAFTDFVCGFLADKGAILSEFEDLEQDSEFEARLAEAKQKFTEQEAEISAWMNEKAEPNLIEVERKSTKFRIKWESLKLFDKKQRLMAVLKKKEALIQGGKH